MLSKINYNTLFIDWLKNKKHEQFIQVTVTAYTLVTL